MPSSQRNKKRQQQELVLTSKKCKKIPQLFRSNANASVGIRAETSDVNSKISVSNISTAEVPTSSNCLLSQPSSGSS